MTQFPALLHVDTFAGRRCYRITVTAANRTSYVFTAEQPMVLPPNRRLEKGQEGRAPKWAVSRREES